MNSQKRGTNLKIQIRMTLSHLGRDPYASLARLTIKQLEELNSSLMQEYKAKKAA